MVPSFETYPEFEEWLAARAAALAMEAEPCDLSACGPAWQISWKWLFRLDMSFFQVIGVWVKRAAGREMPNWRQIMFAGETDAKAALVVIGTDKQGLVLIRAKAEPGNVGVQLTDGSNSRVLIAPSVQFSKGNLEQHTKFRAGEPGVKPVPLADLLLEPEFVDAEWEQAPMDGGRFYEKVDAMGVLQASGREVADRHVLASPAPADFAWVSRGVLKKLCQRGLANQYLRFTLSVE